MNNGNREEEIERKRGKKKGEVYEKDHEDERDRGEIREEGIENRIEKEGR